MNEKQNIVEEKNNESIEPQVVPEQNETLSEKGKKKGSFLKKGFTIMIFIILLIGGLILFYPKYKESMDQSSFSKKVNKIMKEALDYSNSEASKESKTFKSVGIDLKDDVIDAKNMKAGYIVVTEEGTVAFEMTDGKYCAKKDTNSEKITIKNLGKELCDGSDLVKKEEKEVEIEEDNPFRKTIINVFSTLQAKYDVNSNHYEGEEFDLTNGKISYEGKKLTAGYAVITPVGQIAFEMTDGEYCAIKELDNEKIKYRKKTENEACDGSSLKGSLMNWSIPKDAKRNGDTYYLNCFMNEEGKSCMWEKQKVSNVQDTYTCLLKDCELYEYDPITKQSVIREGTNYYLYYHQTKEEKILDIDNTEINQVRFITYEGKNYGLSIGSSKTGYAVYSIEGDKMLTDYIFPGTVSVNRYKGEIVYTALTYNKSNGASVPTLHVFDFHTKNEIKTVVGLGKYNVYQNEGNSLYIGGFPGRADVYSYRVLDDELNSTSSIYSDFGANSDSTITLYEGNSKQFKVINCQQQTVYTSKEYEEVYGVFKDYVLVRDNNSLKLIDNRGKEIANFLELANNYVVDFINSGWSEENRKYGIYILVYDESVSPDKKGSILKYYYIPATKEKGMIKTISIGI